MQFHLATRKGASIIRTILRGKLTASLRALDAGI